MNEKTDEIDSNNLPALVGRILADGEPKAFLIEQLPFTIGRRTDVSLRIPSQAVSGRHAEIFTRNGKLFVRDLGSTNGTFLNGERVTDEAPLTSGAWLQFASMPFQVTNEERKTPSQTMDEEQCDHTMALVQFEGLMANEAVTPLFQSIEDLQTETIIAYEVLASSRFVGLQNAKELFKCAEDLGQGAELSHLMRRKGIQMSDQFLDAPHLFLNVHPSEFADNSNLDWIGKVREMAPLQRLTIEVHEDCVANLSAMLELRLRLSDYGIGFAFDDFGAGQARIAELAKVRPDYVKFDRSLIANIDQDSPDRLQFVKFLVEAVNHLGIISLAEGIETIGEREACKEIGFVLGQGYQVGLPAPIESYVAQHSHFPTS